MPEVGVGTVTILPDFSDFGRRLERGIRPHLDGAGRSMESTFASSAKKSAEEVDRAFRKTAGGLHVPIRADTANFATDLQRGTAPALRPVDVPVDADTRAFARLPDDIRPHVKRAGDEIERTFKSSSSSAAKAAAGAIGAALTIDFGRRLLDLGNKTAVFRQKTRVVFEDSTADVQRWAKANNKALGLTEDRLAGLAANFGDLLKPMGFTAKEAAQMSTRVVGLAGALSAWSAGQRSAAEVSEILSAAMLGEREALKGLGISIQQADVDTRLLQKGQAELTGTARQQAEALATQELIFEKSTDAQRAWADGSFDAIKSQNELRAKVSETTQEVAAGLLPVFETAATVLNAIPGPAIAAAGGIAGIAAAGVGISKVVGWVGDLSNRVGDLVTKRPALTGTMGLLGGTAAAAAGAFALGEGVVAVASALERLDDVRVNVPDLQKELAGKLDLRQTLDNLDPRLLGEIRVGFDEVSRVARDFGLTFEETARKSTKAGLDKTLDDLDKSLAGLVQGGAVDLARQRVEQLAEELGRTPDEVLLFLDDYRDAVSHSGAASATAAAAQKELKTTTDATGDSTKAARAEMERFAASLDAAYGASQSLLGTQLSVADAIDALRESAATTTGEEHKLADAIRVHGRASAEAKTAGEALEDARRAQLHDLDALAQANVRLAEQQAAAAGKAFTDRDAYAAYRDELIRLKDEMAPGAPLRQHLQGLIDQLPPPKIKSELVLDTSKWEASLSQVASLQKSLGGSLSAKFFPADLLTRHTGGLVHGAGREVPVLAERGEYVIQAAAVKALGTEALDRLNRYHDGGLIPPASMAAITAPTIDPLLSGGVNIHGGINVTGVRNGEDAATLLPMKLASELFLVAG